MTLEFRPGSKPFRADGVYMHVEPTTYLVRWSYPTGPALERFRGTWTDAREHLQAELERCRQWHHEGCTAAHDALYDRAVDALADTSLLAPGAEWSGSVGARSFALEAL